MTTVPDEYDGELDNPARDLLHDVAEVSTPSTAAIRWLDTQGVAIETIYRRAAIGTAYVCFQPTGRYTPVVTGEFAFIFACQTMDGVSDLAAWQPSTGRLMTRLGAVGVLGQREAEDARDDINARPVRVWRTPLNWLRAGRRGVVIIDREIGAYILSDLPVIPDAEHGRALKRLRVPGPRVIRPAADRIAA